MKSITKIIVFLLASAAALSPAGTLRARTAPTDGVVESVWVSMRIRVPTPEALGEAGGLGLVLIDPDSGSLPEDFAWDEPNAEHSIGIGFDVHDPVPDKAEGENGRVMGWFDADGNWYDRPQREISVHANGRERINVLSDVEFRTGRWTDVDVHVRSIAGGARVLVLLDGRTVIDEPVWGVRPSRLLANAGVEGEAIEIKDLAITRTTALAAPMPEPIHFDVFNEALVQNAATIRSDIDFSSIPESTARVVATLTLSEPEMGYDHWDKKGTVGITVPGANGADDERFEVFRFITPFRRGWSWSMDVTDLLPLFRDQRSLDANIGTSMKGWLVSFSLDFYPGVPEREPIEVVKLWSGDAEIGNPDNPVEKFYEPRTVEVPEAATHARVRATVTGHGMLPSSQNAGEFMPIWRTLTISTTPPEGSDVLEIDYLRQSARDQLWKTDCYLNPCRPQGGTWKFDRAGWAPGSTVEPWCVDTQREFVFGDTVTVEYELDPYLNEAVGETWAPHHWTEAVIVFFR